MELTAALIKYGLSIHRRLNADTNAPLNSQTKTLINLLKKSAYTQFGNHYNFSQILSKYDLIEEFKKNVPIHDYDKIYNEWWHLCREGGKDVAWKGKINYFALSSGTSGSPSKYIPISDEMIKSIRKTGVKMYSELAISGMPIQQFSKHMLMLGGNVRLKKENHYYYGDLSGILIHKLPLWFTNKYKPGLKIASIQDYHEKMLAIAKNASKWDIGIVSGIPSWVQMMLEYIKEVNKINNIQEIWPNFKVYAHGGIAFEPYREAISNLFGKNTFFLDSYLASEGFIAYQDSMKEPNMKLALNNDIFYEFVPFNSDNFDSAGNIKPNATTYTVGEVKEGIDYAILLTTCAGAWRYLIGDTIKFVDAEQCKLIITGRTKHFLSICGEHLSIDNMNQALQAVQRNLNISIREFTVNGERRTNQYSHKWYISVEKPFNKNIVAEELDRQLQLLNDDYKAVRKAVLDKISVETLTPSVFYDYLKSKNKLGGQSKFPRVMNNEQFKDWELFVKSVVELV